MVERSLKYGGSVYGVSREYGRDNLGTTLAQSRGNPRSFMMKNGSLGSFFEFLMVKYIEG